ncbi:hypothetical protein [Corynebacterium mayonis]|uniref:hypothetical protein n=1 Tax=Corynebacterium mayonis TaxID=3062461 RepID=UPI003140A1ED
MDAPHVDAHRDAEQIDYNALDNTFAGQLIQAGFIVGFYAVGDLTRHPLTARAVVAAANLATIAAFNAFDEVVENDLTTVVQNEGGPAASWAVLGGLTAVAVGLTFASASGHRAIARSLRRRGVSAPWSTMGAVAAAGYLAYKQVK